jgi:hypothetical protein
MPETGVKVYATEPRTLSLTTGFGTRMTPVCCFQNYLA